MSPNTTLQELFGDISDLSDEECDESSGHVIEHPQIRGLLQLSNPLSPDLTQSLVPLLHTLFDVQNGANQAMRFGANLPPFLAPLLSIGATLLPPHLSQRTPAFDSMIANYYQPGQGICSHVDLARFEDGVVVFSFISALVMDFTYVGGDGATAGYTRANEPSLLDSVPVLLESGSGICLTGEARFKWAHGIAERQQDLFEGMRIQRKQRISITLRKLKPNQSDTAVYSMSDSVVRDAEH
ncbi:hypothetical protein CcCBS67573_g10668 [Chytriomyces confervae]|uniref:Alpha-ketoglutarate-dependent dioxygenase AlkB-like domain-containing protein n=1 Tax=Chytriomyces confervae TaxID=246404 RepID=A0A507CM44_9FUNG|nr:hypothetical protein CcCBS67573_g10668 [Chytriomyces confervae]